MIWGVQVGQGGREGLVNQLQDLPAQGKSEEEEDRRGEDASLTVHVVLYHKGQLYFKVDHYKMNALTYLLSFGTRCSIQTWKAPRSSLSLEVRILFSRNTYTR